jgi:hypothetical protein
MRSFRASILVLLLPLSLAACRDGALGIGGDHPDGGGDMPGPPACSTLTDPTACAARTDCHTGGCPSCDGPGVTICLPASEPGPFCPAIECENPCEHKDESQCSADSSCVAVYTDPGTCDCAKPGCCMQFTRCDSGPAQCSPSSVGPQCEGLPWDCGDDYEPIFNGSCQTGCVKAPQCVADCRTLGCGDEEECAICWVGYSCIPKGAVC